MVNSILESAGTDFFPVTIDADAVTSQLLQVFPELKFRYGFNVTVKLLLSAEDKTGLAKMNAEEGFILGQDGTTFTIDILASNEDVQDDVAVSFSMNMLAKARTNIFAFMVFPNIDSIQVSGAKVTKDNIGMYAHDYNKMFNAVFTNAAADINDQYNKMGFPLGNLNPTVGLLSGLLQKFTVSPLKSDEFLLIGFSMYKDMPTLANYRNEEVEVPEGATTIFSQY